MDGMVHADARYIDTMNLVTIASKRSGILRTELTALVVNAVQNLCPIRVKVVEAEANLICISLARQAMRSSILFNVDSRILLADSLPQSLSRVLRRLFV